MTKTFLHPVSSDYGIKERMKQAVGVFFEWSKLIFLAECSMKGLEQFNIKCFLKNHNSLFHPIKLVCFIQIRVKQGE